MNTDTSGGMDDKPALSLGGIINLSMGFLGIQMGFALQNGNASRILSNFGADVHQLSWFWLVAPFTGLLVQPIIGHLGDNTWGRLGRRKPYFLIGAILATLGLIFLPNSNVLAGEGLSASDFMGVSAILWIGVAFLALMDASFNVSMEPFRALVGDLLPKRQGTLGFSVQTILISTGAIVGSFIPWVLTNWLGVSNEAESGFVAPNVVWSFYLGAAILLTTIIYTIVTVKEYPPEEFLKYQDDSEKERKSNMFKAIFRDTMAMPRRMKRLAGVQFFSWFALFSMWVYTTSAISTHHYGLSPDNTHSAEFNTAGDYTSFLFGWYNTFALVFAFLLSPMARATSRKFIHFIALLSGGLGLLSMYFLPKEYLVLSMLGIGFAWASILSMPYALLIDSLPRHKMGVYMGIFNFFIVIPQIVNGFIGGPIVHTFFDDYPIYYLVFGGALFVIAALLTLRIREPLFAPKDFSGEPSEDVRV